jgi:Tfp pilus assembly protein PilO
MTTRDRIALMVIGALVVLGAVWLLLISPERDHAAKLGAQVKTAQAQLASVESQATDARAAQARYASAYASIVDLGKAVPPSEEVPSLIYQIAQASNQKHVEFNSITTGGAPGTGAGASSAATPVATSAAGFTQMPFTFIFNGSYNDLYHLFQQLDEATVHTPSGGLRVSGRLLTLQSVKLEPVTKEATSSSGGEQLTGTISATAYVLPASQGLTAGATSAAPATTGAATSASSTTSSSSTPAPAAVVTAGADR